ncbi:hypothetical protein [Pseudoalteromonas luteoviolacea]|uniref:Ig-like domain-containing protein n=1 Tax=Pseudoalteromonas luteoviolacea S4054 TaxID=1129367 RepID=A0A0F6ADH9_9GAMM|nr:hypothetical protein [Pseudoalteromonas luteoviolacea]AOT08309.1 hypothetical protein S4054249_10835 [Pseudoalteromonas luteoviolacea]AOT13225.1 hypothetical protein S40542_10810 [Pseudoalteromonas luteoviolacea]AOT18138.1 hypothetical protein S4054_10810 [Pseudoalteromonas luteoviolacea]KKE84245.1 hypothetical protein N479_10120 [Pseudoalteromonas luteoviolacea S4054]KZN76150.1 hypothetical protein N481_07295 [Pseudoalteromonas luteoviolacea S4047-1]
MKYINGISALALLAMHSAYALPKPTGSFYFQPSTITVGQNSTLRWYIRNATSCKNQWGTEIGTNGSYTTTPSVGVTEYRFTCSGPGGSTLFKAVRTVKPHPLPTANFAYSPRSVEVGTPITLRWSTQHATSCKNPWGTEIGTSGSYTFTSNKPGTVRYNFKCSGQGGSTTASASYTLTPAAKPTITNLHYSPQTAYIGQRQTLNFNYNNASKCYAYNNAGNEVVYYQGEQKSGSYQWTSPPRSILVNNGELEVFCQGRGGVTQELAHYRVKEHPTVSNLKEAFMARTPTRWLDNIHCDTEVIIDGRKRKVCDVKLMYNAWLGIDGLLDLYLASGDKTLVELALQLSEKYKSTGQDHNGDGYLDWFSTPLYEYNGKMYDHDHYEWRAGSGVARTAAVILDDPNLVDLHARATSIQDFAEQHIWRKWYAKSNQFNNLRVTHFIGRVGTIALFLNKHSSDQTLKNQYENFIKQRGQILKNSLEYVTTNNANAYNIRCYAPSGHSSQDCATASLPIQGTIDVSHAGDTLSFIVEAYLAGGFGVFDQQDIIRLSNTVKKLIISDSDQKFRSNVCSIDACSYNRSTDPYYRNIGAYQSQWAKLAQFDPALLDIYLYWLSTQSINVSPKGEPEIMIDQTQRLPGGYGSPNIFANIALAVVRAL